MLTLLDLLSAVALLIWGTHIVRTGILRVYGAQLRRVLSQNMSKRPLAFIAGILVTAMVQSIETSSLHLELIADMKRLNSLFCSSAYAVLETSDTGALASETAVEQSL